jgi:hypothetical protein
MRHVTDIDERLQLMGTRPSATESRDAYGVRTHLAAGFRKTSGADLKALHQRGFDKKIGRLSLGRSGAKRGLQIRLLTWKSHT